jgi:DNA-binding CsgD family transcriptional regulator
MFRPADVTRSHRLGDGDAAFGGEAFPGGAWARDLLALGRQHGFRHCLLARYPKADSPEFAANLVFCTWPDELRLAYEAAEVYAGSQLIARIKQSILPIFTEDNLFLGGAGAEARQPVAPYFQQAAIGSSLIYSLYDRNQTQYVLAFSGRESVPERQEVASLMLSAVELLDACVDGLVPRIGPKEKLSAREIECLRWSAAGKSSDEIAIILDISSHTVVSYLKSAMRKLEAVNRMQAVARACRYRLL